MKNTAERRLSILRTMCERRSDKIKNLAEEFGVSERIISRDIGILSESVPINTVPGKYGGIIIANNYSYIFPYFSDEQERLLKYFNDTVKLNDNDALVYNQMIKKYVKPAYSKPQIR